MAMVYGASALYGHSTSYAHIDHHGGWDDGGHDGGYDEHHDYHVSNRGRVTAPALARFADDRRCSHGFTVPDSTQRVNYQARMRNAQ